MLNINYLYCYFSGKVLRSLKFRKSIDRLSNQWGFRNNIYTSSRSIRYTQPTAITHPHLLKNGEIAPGITADIYKNRRQRMIEIIRKTFPSSSENKTAHLIIIPSSSVIYMTEDIPYFFRQNSNFLYMCGFREPKSVLVLFTLPDRSDLDYESVLFIPRPTTHSIEWEGSKMDLNTVVNFLGVDKALYTDDLETFLQSFGKSFSKFTVWYDYSNTSSHPVHNKISDFILAYSGNISVESPMKMFHQIRVIKSDVEIELIRKSCKIAAEAMKEVMKFSRPMMSEAHLEAKMDYECRLHGADHAAFPPVVAGGARAKTIHYTDNNQIIKDNEMVLMDAGCEFHGYVSDITRTWPVNGQFTNPQKELYEIILSIQEEMIQLFKAKISLDDMLKIMCCKLGKKLQELGIIPKSVSQEKLAQAAFEMCPHHVSHYLGMDVHDTSLISRSIKLLPGMVVTVEPGIYLSNDTKYPEKYRGLGIRLEDDILITNDGYEVLTSNCPKKVHEIEELCKKD